MTDKPFLTRRSFFQRLLGRGQDGQSFFALQLVFDTGPREDLHRELRRIMAELGGDDPDTLRRTYKRLVDTLLRARGAWEFAYFEYIPDPEDAPEAFDHWVTDIEDAIAAEAHDPYDPFVVERYVAVSIVLLLDHPWPLHGQAHAADWFYSREGLEELLRSVARVDYDGALAYGAFVVPDDELTGITREDLDDEGWDYLQPILI